jgi:hypothetical protein
MAKLDPKLIKIFAGNSGDKGTTVFGSTKDGNTQFSKDPDILQSSNYLEGWKGAKLLNKTPLLEDFNTVFYNITRELFYLVQTGGFREWVDDINSGVDALYNKGSVVGILENNAPVLYYSLTDNNRGNNPQTDTGANWKKLYFTRDELIELLAGGVHYKGEMDTNDDLPTTADVGDEYLVLDDGGGNSIFAVWNGEEWNYTQNDLSKIIDGSDLKLNNLSAEAKQNIINIVREDSVNLFDIKYTNVKTIPTGFIPLKGDYLNISDVPTIHKALKDGEYPILSKNEWLSKYNNQNGLVGEFGYVGDTLETAEFLIAPHHMHGGYDVSRIDKSPSEYCQDQIVNPPPNESSFRARTSLGTYNDLTGIFYGSGVVGHDDGYDGWANNHEVIIRMDLSRKLRTGDRVQPRSLNSRYKLMYIGDNYKYIDDSETVLVEDCPKHLTPSMHVLNLSTFPLAIFNDSSEQALIIVNSQDFSIEANRYVNINTNDIAETLNTHLYFDVSPDITVRSFDQTLDGVQVFSNLKLHNKYIYTGSVKDLYIDTYPTIDSTKELTQPVSVNTSGKNPLYLNNKLFITRGESATTNNNILVYNFETKTWSNINFGVSSGAVNIIYVKNYIWVAGASLFRINPDTLECVNCSVVLGGISYGVCFDGTSLYYKNNNNANLIEIDISDVDNPVMSTIAIGLTAAVFSIYILYINASNKLYLFLCGNYDYCVEVNLTDETYRQIKLPVSGVYYFQGVGFYNNKYYIPNNTKNYLIMDISDPYNVVFTNTLSTFYSGERRGAVQIGNKIYVFSLNSNYSCEIFDMEKYEESGGNTTEAVKHQYEPTGYNLEDAVPIGNNVYCTLKDNNKVLVYDLSENLENTDIVVFNEDHTQGNAYTIMPAKDYNFVQNRPIAFLSEPPLNSIIKYRHTTLKYYQEALENNKPYRYPDYNYNNIRVRNNTANTINGYLGNVDSSMAGLTFTTSTNANTYSDITTTNTSGIAYYNLTGNVETWMKNSNQSGAFTPTNNTIYTYGFDTTQYDNRFMVSNQTNMPATLIYMDDRLNPITIPVGSANVEIEHSKHFMLNKNYLSTGTLSTIISPTIDVVDTTENLFKRYQRYKNSTGYAQRLVNDGNRDIQIVYNGSTSATLVANGSYVYANNAQLFYFISDISNYQGLKFIVKTPIEIVAGSFPLLLQPQNLYNHANAVGDQYFANANDTNVILEWWMGTSKQTNIVTAPESVTSYGGNWTGYVNQVVVLHRSNITKITTFPTSMTANTLYYIPSTLSSGKITNSTVNQISITIYGYNSAVVNITTLAPDDTVAIPVRQVFSSSANIQLQADV